MTQQIIKENLNKQIRDYFVKLKFNNDLHKYTYENRTLTSVSKIVEQFAEKIDWTKKAYEIAEYKNTTGSKLIKSWDYERDISIVKGHKTHHFGELLGKHARKPETNEERAILRFWNTVSVDRYIRVDREVRMYHKQFFYAGTCDFILYDTWTDTFIIGDYKTNKDLFKNYRGKKLLYPFDLLLDQPYSKYEIQLSLYKILLEQIGIPVSEMWVIWTMNDDKCKEKRLPVGTYKKFITKDHSSALFGWLTKQNALWTIEQ